MMLMSDKTLDPCDSLYDAACGGWIVNVTNTVMNAASGPGLDNVSVMDHNKLNIDKKIKGGHLLFVCQHSLQKQLLFSFYLQILF